MTNQEKRLLTTILQVVPTPACKLPYLMNPLPIMLFIFGWDLPITKPSFMNSSKMSFPFVTFLKLKCSHNFAMSGLDFLDFWILVTGLLGKCDRKCWPRVVLLFCCLMLCSCSNILMCDGREVAPTYFSLQCWHIASYMMFF